MFSTKRGILLLSTASLALSGCGQLSTRRDLSSHYQSIGSPDESIDLSAEVSLEDRENIQKVSESIHSIPVEMNKEVRKWLHYFSKKDRERFQRFLNRGSKYREVVENVLEENGLPGELYYLAMIESGYQNHATSIASAVGVWQFIPGTGRRYGLKINHYIDERRDPIRATEAAVRYLRDLYNVFGSWHLAMASYNAGEMRVVRAIFKSKTRNFWELVKLKALPPETRNYVPKFLAAVEIGSNPEKYGFTLPKGEDYPDLNAVQIPGPISLKTISAQTGVPLASLKEVNPHLLRGHIPPGPSGYPIWVPIKHVARIQESKHLLVAKAKDRFQEASVAVTSGRHHRVRRGENLGLIARKYSMSVAQLKRINDLKSNRIYPGMKLEIASKAYRSSQATYYRVKRGDNLSSIARRFGMSLAQIKRLNGMRSNRIYAGTRLKVNSRLGGVIASYKVRRGDNLTAIARRFQASVGEIKNLNNLSDSTIYPGQVLRVRR